QRVLWLSENELEGRLVEVLKCRNDWQSADKFGDEAIFQEVLRFHLAENFAGLAVLGRQDLGIESDRGRPAARRNDLVKPGEGASAHEQDIGGDDLQELLLRMLSSALRRYRGDGPFHDLEQGLLYALTRNIPRDGGVVGLAADFVDLVDIDDAALRALDIV